LKVGGEFYFSIHEIAQINWKIGATLKIDFYKKVDLKDYGAAIVKNIWKLVDPANLSGGDRLLLKKIAIESFYRMLEIGATSEGRAANYTLFNCIKTDRNEMAMSQLERFGFNIRPCREIMVYNSDGTKAR
jgi:hypothetical protein